MRPLLCCLLAMPAAPAAARADVVPGDYGGGVIARGSKALRLAVGSSWMWARVAPGGQARIGGVARVACGLTRFDAEVALAPDGSFRFSRVRKTREAGHRLRAAVTVRGRFDGAAASGTVSGRLRNRHPDGVVRRCSTRGARRWQMRMRAAAGPPGPPAAGATYRGLTAQQGDVPRPFLLRVAGSGSRVAVAVFDYTRRCSEQELFLNDITPSATIRPDGSFTIRERFTLRYIRVRERFRVRVDGRFTAGGVTGALQVTSVARRRSSGRVVDRCDTGQVGFDARL